MTADRRNKIIEILNKIDDRGYIIGWTKTGRPFTVTYESFADEILALPIDVPSKKEIDMWAGERFDNLQNESPIIMAGYNGSRLGAKWAIDEIIKRNK
jgi:hypothetical protein